MPTFSPEAIQYAIDMLNLEHVPTQEEIESPRFQSLVSSVVDHLAPTTFDTFDRFKTDYAQQIKETLDEYHDIWYSDHPRDPDNQVLDVFRHLLTEDIYNTLPSNT